MSIRFKIKLFLKYEEAKFQFQLILLLAFIISEVTNYWFVFKIALKIKILLLTSQDSRVNSVISSPSLFVRPS